MYSDPYKQPNPAYAAYGAAPQAPAGYNQPSGYPSNAEYNAQHGVYSSMPPQPPAAAYAQPQAYPGAYPPTAAPGYVPPAQDPYAHNGGVKAHQAVEVPVYGVDGKASGSAGGPGYTGAPGSYSDFMDKAVRRGFIRKVYLILTAQLLVTFGLTFLFVLNDNVKTWVKANPGFMYAAIAVQFAAIIALACCGDVRRRFPGNYILLGVFTLAESYLVGAISSYYDTNAVLIAMGICAGVTFALVLFACQTRIDFTGCGAGLYAVLMSFVIMGILMAIFRGSHNNVMNCLYAGIGAAIFSLYLVYDTQIIVGGKHKYKISTEEYVFAALNLYLDIINLFLYILRIVGAARK